MVRVKKEKKILGYSYSVYDDNGKYITYFKSYNEYDEAELEEFVEDILHVDPLFSFLYIDHIYGVWKKDRKSAITIVKRLKTLDQYYNTYHVYREYLPRNIFYELHGIRFLINSDNYVLLVMDEAVFFTRLRAFITLLYYIEQGKMSGIMRKAKELIPITDVEKLLSFLSSYLAFGSVDRKTYRDIRALVLKQKLIVSGTSETNYVKEVLRAFLGDRHGNRDKS